MRARGDVAGRTQKRGQCEVGLVESGWHDRGIVSGHRHRTHHWSSPSTGHSERTAPTQADELAKHVKGGRTLNLQSEFKIAHTNSA